MSLEAPIRPRSQPLASLGSDLAEVLSDALVALLRRRPRDISLTAASVLSTLDRNGPTRLGDLAGCEGVAQPSMSALVGNLEKLGLVERRSDPSDGRAVLVAITPEGRARRAERHEAMLADIRAGAARLDQQERSAIEAALPALGRLVSELVPATVSR